MNRFKVIICIVLCSVIFAGCATQASVSNPEPSSSADATVQTENPVTTTSAEASTQGTTKPVTTVPVTTVPVTTVPVTTEGDKIVYEPISNNKVSSDFIEDPTEPQSPQPSNPASTDDEVVPETNPTEDKRYKYIAFTFDDGPHYELTYKFADKLAEYGGVGTFYVVGDRIHGEQEKAMKYAYDLGNEIGVHGYTHKYYYDSCSESRFKSEISKTANKIKEVTGEYPLTMRPIGGGITSSRVKSSGFVVVNWNVDSDDWRYTGGGSSKKQNINAIYNNVIKATDQNDIILFHEIYYNSYDAFCKVIDKLYKNGFRFVTVSQLLGVDKDDIGIFYYSAD